MGKGKRPEGGGGNISNVVVSTCACGEACVFEKRFGLGGFFEEEWKDRELAKLNFALRSNETGPNPSNNVAELKAIEKIVDIGVKHNVSVIEIGTDSNFCLKNLRKARAWREQRWMDGTGRPIKNALIYNNILRMVDENKTKVFLHKVKAHAGIEGNCRADDFAKIGCQGKIRQGNVVGVKESVSLAERLLMFEIEKIKFGQGFIWLKNLRQEAAHDIKTFKKICSLANKGMDSRPPWALPEASILEKYTLEGSVDKYGEVFSHIHIRNKRN